MPTTTRLTRAPRVRRAPADAVGVAAVDLARAAAVEVAGEGLVGEHLGAAAEPDAGERAVVHRFAALAPGYRGWAWTVVVARASRAKAATVCEAVLLPTEEAVLAPAWLPWAERLRPGDVGPTDTLPRVADDDRLVQGYETAGEAARPEGGDDAPDDALLTGESAALRWELGLGRARVLGPVGRSEAAARWYGGEAGPTTPAAKAAAAACESCAFFVPLAGGLRRVFGVCANDWSPADGRVVSRDHGCGAHSETDLVIEPERPAAPVVDDEALEALQLGGPTAAEPADPTDATG